MPRLLTVLRGAGTGLALALAFLPALVLGGSGIPPPGVTDDRTPASSQASGSEWGSVDQAASQQAPADDDDLPNWVWAVVGGTSGAAVAVALGYKLWLGRRND